MIESKFLTKSKFSVLIENAVIKQKMTYMDAVLDVCDKNAIDPEDVKKSILSMDAILSRKVTILKVESYR